jgi:hypothetical protein
MHQVNMVTTIFYDSYDNEEEKFPIEEDEDTDSEDPEYGNLKVHEAQGTAIPACK